MTRLAFAIAFMSVFGIVAYAVVVFLSKLFKSESNKENNNSPIKPKDNEVTN